MLARMYDAWLELDTDPDLRVGVLTGARRRRSARASTSRPSPAASRRPSGRKRFAEDDDLHWKALLRHFRPSKPLVAAVEGYALAGGTEILQGTEIRVAGSRPPSASPRWRRGLFPLGGSTVRLPRQIAYTHAAEILLTGRHVSAQEALEIGLIGHVVPDGQALAKAIELAERSPPTRPLSVQAVLRACARAARCPRPTSLANELDHGWPIFATEDAKEGAKAFKEKRPANFQGK